MLKKMKSEDIRVLVVDDEEIVRESLAGWFEEDGYIVDTADNATTALNKLNKANWDIYFLDIKMPGMDGLELHRRIREIDKEALVIIITAYASVDTAVQALKEGAFDYITKPFDPEALSRLIKTATKQRKLTKENIKLKDNLESLIEAPEIIGNSAHIQQLKKQIQTVAATNTTIMIRGNSGTGKELVARAIHYYSERRFFPLVTVNCGAFAETLLESELFGHEKGAFTGALYRRKGKLEIANGGTLFLDEIGTIGMKTQIDLLRAIESKELTRLGGNEIVKSDFRIICATNIDLEEMVKTGEFREDLYYRLQVYVLNIEPLKNRPEDIPELVMHFIQKYRLKMNKPVERIESDALELLMHHPWNGNVRELENAVERAMVISKKSTLHKIDFLLNSASPITSYRSCFSIAEVEKQHILNMLEQNHWNITSAAKTLEVDRATIYKKLNKYGIKRPENE